MRFAKFMAGAMLVTTSIPAGAAVLTQTRTFNLQGSVGFGGPVYFPNATFDKFDPTLGQLNNYSLSLTSVFRESYGYDTVVLPSQPRGAFAGTASTSGGRLLELNNGIGPELFYTITASGSWSGTNPWGFPTWSFGVSGTGAGSCTGMACGAALSSVTGTTPLTIQVYGKPSVAITGTMPASLAAGPFIYDDEQVTLTLTYDYDAAAVPEPANWAMMLFGFGLAGAALRRFRVRSSSAPLLR